MSLTLVLIVLLFSIIVLFSEDFAKVGKKILNIWGMKLFLPIFIASVLIIDFQDTFAWILDIIIDKFSWCITKVAAVLPFTFYNRQLTAIFSLMVIGPLSVILFDWIRMKKGYRSFEYRNQTILMLWTVAAILYVFIH